MANIEQYESNLKGYSQTINNFKEKIRKAENDKLVAQTKLDNYAAQMQELEQECQEITGGPITEIDAVLENTMDSIEKVVAQINEMNGGN